MATGAFESIVIGGRRFATKADDSVETLLKGKTNETIMHGDGSFHNQEGMASWAYYRLECHC